MERECSTPELCTLSSLKSRTASAALWGRNVKEMWGTVSSASSSPQMSRELQEKVQTALKCSQLEWEPAGGGRGSLKAKGGAAAQGGIGKAKLRSFCSTWPRRRCQQSCWGCWPPRGQQLSHSLMESLGDARGVSQQQMRGQNELWLWEQMGRALSQGWHRKRICGAAWASLQDPPCCWKAESNPFLTSHCAQDEV